MLVTLFTVIAVVVAVCAFNIYKFCTIKVYAGKVIEISPLDVPAAQVGPLIKVQKQLIKLGFEYECHVTRPRIIEGQEWGIYGVVYYNSHLESYALASVEPVVHAALECRLYFINIDDQGDVYETISGSDFPVSCFPASMHVIDAMTLSHPQHLETHRKSLEANNVVLSGARLSRDSLLELCERAVFSGLVESGALVTAGDAYRLRLKTAIGVFKQSNITQYKLNALKRNLAALTEPQADSLTANEDQQLEAYETHQRVQASNKLGTQGKTLLLLVSIVLFGASFGLGFDLSMETLAILIVVIFVHEMGHLFGMWLFGYRDLGMFFVPFLGALASGKKEEIKPWQEAIVLVLGPLPGYVLGLAILSSGQADFPEWVINYAIMSIILNVLNLLPFMPLDGGRLINIGLFNKVPVLQLGFYAASIICFLLAGLFLEEKIGFVIAVLLAIGLPNLYKEVGFLRKLLKEKIHKEQFSTAGILRALVRDETWMRLSAQNRWAILDSLSYRVQHAKAGAVTSVGILVLWIGSLLAPVYISMGEEGRNDFSVVLSAMMNDGYEGPSIEQLEANYADAAGHEEKLQAMSALLVQASYDSPELGEKYWRDLQGLSQAPSLSARQQESAYTYLSNFCSLYEGEDCSLIYYTKLIDLEQGPGDLSDERFQALVTLAENSDVSTTVRMAYLEKAGTGMVRAQNLNSVPANYSWMASAYNNLGEPELTVRYAQFAVDTAQQQVPYQSWYYMLELVNVYAKLGEDQAAIDLIEAWESNREGPTEDNLPISQNREYIKAWLLLEQDPRQAKQVLDNLVAYSEIDKIELKLAHALVEKTLGVLPAESELDEIFKVADTDDYQWYALATNLKQPQPDLRTLRDDHGFSFIANRWYSKMKMALGANQLASLNEKLEAIEAYN